MCEGCRSCFVLNHEMVKFSTICGAADSGTVGFDHPPPFWGGRDTGVCACPLSPSDCVACADCSGLHVEDHLHGGGEVAEAVSLLGDMAMARPWEVIGDERDLLRRQYVQGAHARIGRLLGIGVVGELEARLFNQQDLVVGQVADRGQRLAVGSDHEDHVADGVARCGDRLDAR